MAGLQDLIIFIKSRISDSNYFITAKLSTFEDRPRVTGCKDDNRARVQRSDRGLTIFRVVYLPFVHFP